MTVMKNGVKKIVKEGLGKIGDKANEKICPFYTYQPRACRRGESISSEQKKAAK